MYTPFNYSEAEEICEDFEDLIDTEFTDDEDNVYLVESVVVCPFPESEKQVFIVSYYVTKDSRMALNDYEGELYDVLIFAHNADDEDDVQQLSIRDFATRHGISYDFPRH